MIDPQRFISVARALSRCSNAHDLKVGALLVENDRIIATSWNDETVNPVQHAEKPLCFGGPKDSFTMYVTTSPCLACAKSIIAVGAVKKLYYQHSWWDKAANELLRANGVEVVQLKRGDK